MGQGPTIVPSHQEGIVCINTHDDQPPCPRSLRVINTKVAGNRGFSTTRHGQATAVSRIVPYKGGEATEGKLYTPPTFVFLLECPCPNPLFRALRFLPNSAFAPFRRKGQLDRISHATYLPPTKVAYACPGLIAIVQDTVQESIPIP